jgi:tetratricopeptide (TPR) repeat protein
MVMQSIVHNDGSESLLMLLVAVIPDTGEIALSEMISLEEIPVPLRTPESHAEKACEDILNYLARPAVPPMTRLCFTDPKLASLVEACLPLRDFRITMLVSECATWHRAIDGLVKMIDPSRADKPPAVCKDFANSKEDFLWLKRAGNNLYESGEYRGALAQYFFAWSGFVNQQCPGLSTEDAGSVASNMSLVYLLLGEIDDAVRMAGEAVRVRPNWWKAHYRLGMAFRAQGKLSDAQRCVAMAESLDSNPHAELAQLKIQLAEEPASA